MIRNLAIRNFKAFRNQSFELAPITLLCGLNGSGKSSLLQALLLLRQSFDEGLLERGRVALNGELVHLGRFEDALFESAEEEKITIELKSASGEDHIWILAFDSKHDRVGALQPGTSPIDPMLPLFGERFRFLGAERIGPRTHYTVPDFEPASSGLGVQGEWTPHYLYLNGERNISIDGCAHPAARSLQLKHQVEAWMGEISPGIQLHFDQERSADLVKLSYSFVARRDRSSQYRPTNVGFGVSYTLPVVTAILSAQPDDLLLLESPEAHVHPHGQARLGELLSRAAAAGVQAIVETHSDHIMNGIRVAVHQNLLTPQQVRVHYFRWNPEDTTGATVVQQIQMDANGRIEEWPIGFFDEMDRSLDILLSPKGR